VSEKSTDSSRNITVNAWLKMTWNYAFLFTSKRRLTLIRKKHYVFYIQFQDIDFKRKISQLVIKYLNWQLYSLNLQYVFFGHQGSLISYNCKGVYQWCKALRGIMDFVVKADGSFMDEWIFWCLNLCNASLFHLL